MNTSTLTTDHSVTITGPAQQSAWSVALSWVLWPLLATLCCVTTAVMLSKGLSGEIVVPVVFLGLAATLSILERVFPHEREWVHGDGQLKHDVAFTLLGSGLPGALMDALLLALLTGITQWIARQSDGGLWPTDWPIVLQVALAVAVADFGSYWGHRLIHNTSWLWPFHAVHHSVPRLWWLNSGRIHPVDSAWMILLSLPLMFLLGTPPDMMVWVAIFTTFVGMLSHSNVQMRCGPLDWIFNTPNMHRWHHSRLLAEGNNNYGENTMIWDVIFGTHYRQLRRRPPTDIGTDTPVPKGVLAQFVEPLRMSWSVLKTGKPV